MSEQRKAAVLVSGGLDSMLAVRVLQEQGIHVEGINFYTGFCVEGHTHAIRKKDQKKDKRNNALWVAEQLGIKLHIVDIVEEYKEVLINPKHGYGANMNPCLDCKIFMVKKAVEWAKKREFDFIATGEVVGQRPMSQRKDTMPVVSNESGADDLLLRPLCAKNLPPTRPEREGWVDRETLYDFSGRTRKPQMALAKQFGFEDYATPAGGCCFLTDESYSVKLVDLWKSRGSRDYEMDDIMLLKVGRHLRPRENFKMIISREEGENNFLMGYKNRYITLRTTDHPGPLVMIDGEASEEDLALAGRILARFGKGKSAEEVTVEIAKPKQEPYEIKVAPMPASQVEKSWYI
ncbi:MAG: tRNA (5-methylaminomethyl-2-thiouridylate)-methyltransferase [Gammaproteobacteria bacterium]|jgi:tRNA U34 2-thiouridine synthase MnmA/TrmU|nr:tRNA (5-methylaminomethyl-2-thiouridylate)-methyltransferase [Gammaproteobacteria bacterium]MBT4605626.1 tRNA (5-methylaminomethyl-2-thiouridylate)-methyltransferase [Thiotrichales bacterium]MBT3471427.1 tRNA (5-methylaminomethyl-2-thiouridylate)-methyltransferase [Gammaproteobacteria bacterium]MBT3966551.1 tRNA (5-methylaminomethyl-2-thiouridylate)-methyltransferase [Gammaproteobacteria bacterium]MBT4079061.1 tRNA (5-methylaminomethyl-2-thiouridylate)-methyltransferase [Gammaproteobacteria 